VTADIGKVGAETLTQGWTGIRHIEVAGPEGILRKLKIRRASSRGGSTPSRHQAKIKEL